MRTSRYIVLSVLFSSPGALLAQGRAPAAVAPAEPTGTVTGHVYCADTNQPARFAKVLLEAVPDEAAAQPAAAKASAPPRTVQPAAPTSVSTITGTALDGTFTLRDVKAGSYFVVVDKTGYVRAHDMFTKKELANPSAETKALMAAVLPIVRVAPNQTERVEVRLDRGAAISGTVRYDDGSPAGELEVHLLHKDESGKWVELKNITRGGFRVVTRTDDHGFFRVASLIPDDYIVDVEMSLTDTTITRFGSSASAGFSAMDNDRFTLLFYGSGVARQKEATPVKVRSGEEVTGQDVTIPLRILRHVTGRIAAGADSHFANAGNVALLYRDDNTELATVTISREDGLFHFDFVPDGDYILKATNVRDVTWEPMPPDPTNPFPMMRTKEMQRELQSYADAEMTLLLDGNRDGMILTVPPDAKPVKSAPVPAAAP